MEAAMQQIRRPWTEDDREKLRTLRGKVPAKELALRLDRTQSAIQNQLWKLRAAAKSSMAGAAAKPRLDGQSVQPNADLVETIIAPAAIERALIVYRQLHERDHSVLLQARKILTEHIYGLIDKGECDEKRLAVSGLIRLKAIERDHTIKSAHDAGTSDRPGR
jgi:hypothetical protein